MNRFLSLSCLRWMLPAVAALVLPVGAGAEIMADPPTPTTEEGVTLAFSVPWPDGCLPAVDEPLVGHRVIFLRLFRSLPPDVGCPQVITRVEGEVGVGPLDSGVWRVYLLGTIADRLPSESSPLASQTELLDSFQFTVVEVGPPTTGRVDPYPLNPNALESFTLTLAGPWSDSCVPEVESVDVEPMGGDYANGGRIVVNALGSRVGCQPIRSQWFEIVTLEPLDPGFPLAPAWSAEVQVRGSRFSGSGVPFRWAERHFGIRPGPKVPEIIALGFGYDDDDTVATMSVRAEFGCDVELSTDGARVIGPPGLGAPVVVQALFRATPAPAPGAPGDCERDATYLLPVGRLVPGEYVVEALLDDRRPGGAGERLWAAGSFTLPDPPGSRRLLDGRFRVSVTWRDFEGNEGIAEGVEGQSGRSTIFAFFEPSNWEMLVKVLDGCPLNDRFWVFASASTDVEYTLRVEDTWTGEEKLYTNELGEAAAAITDTDAFGGCFLDPP